MGNAHKCTGVHQGGPPVRPVSHRKSLHPKRICGPQSAKSALRHSSPVQAQEKTPPEPTHPIFLTIVKKKKGGGQIETVYSFSLMDFCFLSWIFLFSHGLSFSHGLLLRSLHSDKCFSMNVEWSTRVLSALVEDQHPGAQRKFLFTPTTVLTRGRFLET